MRIEEEIVKRLDEEGMAYRMFFHPKMFTSVQSAESARVPKRIYAKAVLAKIDRRDVMFIIPADRRLDPLKVATELKAEDVRVEEEEEVEHFVGSASQEAMVPVGDLYDLPSFIDVFFLKQKHVVFSAGNHETSIKMSMRDFLVLANAQVGDFSVPLQLHRQGAK